MKNLGIAMLLGGGSLLGFQVAAAAPSSARPIPPFPTREASEAERQKDLARFFTPRPGKPVAFKTDLVRDYTGKGEVMDLYGIITITPPRKSCLTITRHRDEPDVRVCRPTSLSFSAHHLANDGSISWEIMRDQGTTPTTLTWPTPHRLAQFVLADADSLLDMQEAPVIGCRVMKERRGRVAYVDIMGQPPLTVSLPETDEPMASEEVPNLYVTTGAAKKKDAQADEAGEKEAKDKAESPGKEKEGNDKGKEESHAKEKGGDAAPEKKGEAEKSEDHGKDTPKASGEDTAGKDSPPPPKDLWRLVPRNTFAMSADHVAAYDLPNGARGLCRYRLRGAPHDPQAGVVECHHTDRFRYLFVHLPCLSQF